MKKIFKQPTIKWASLIVLVMVVTFFACKRTADVQANNETFNVAQAKEWYYGEFKKSPYFNKLNENSPFTTNASKNALAKTTTSNVDDLKKYPKWSLGQPYTKNGFQIVEMPILYSTTTVLLPGTQNESENTKKQLANTTLNKVLFIKQPNGKVAIRLVTIVPTKNYAESKNFDISSNNCNDLDNNFSGYVMVKKWDETPVTTTRIANGSNYQKIVFTKRNANGTFNKANNNSNAKEQTQSQNPDDCLIWVPKVYKTCVSVVNGDEPEAECSEWQYVESPTEGTWENNPDCMGGGELSDEELCLLFGIGCPGDGDEDPCEMYGIGCGGGGDVDCNIACQANATSLSDNAQMESQEHSIEIFDIGNFRKRKDIEWFCHSSNGGWVLFSKEEGVVELTDPLLDHWRWVSLVHKSIKKVGVSVGGNVDVVNDSGTPSFVEGTANVKYASMKIDYTIKFSPVCDCPIISGIPVVQPYTLSYNNNSPHYGAKP